MYVHFGNALEIGIHKVTAIPAVLSSRPTRCVETGVQRLRTKERRETSVGANFLGLSETLWSPLNLVVSGFQDVPVLTGAVLGGAKASKVNLLSRKFLQDGKLHLYTEGGDGIYR